MKFYFVVTCEKLMSWYVLSTNGTIYKYLLGTPLGILKFKNYIILNYIK